MELPFGLVPLCWDGCCALKSNDFEPSHLELVSQGSAASSCACTIASSRACTLSSRSSAIFVCCSFFTTKL